MIAVPSCTWLGLLPQLSTTAAVGRPACVAVQRNCWLQGRDDMTWLLGMTSSSSRGVLGWSVNGQAGPALLLYPSFTGPGAGWPGPPGAPRALNFSMLCPELLLVLCPLRNLHEDKTTTITDTTSAKKQGSARGHGCQKLMKSLHPQDFNLPRSWPSIKAQVSDLISSTWLSLLLHLLPLFMKQTSVHSNKALIWLISGCLLVAYPLLATCISHCWLYPSVQLCQGRISSDHCTLCLRNLPAGVPCQAGFIRGAAWKSCTLRSTLTLFTATSLGKHMAVVKAQLPLTFSGWKENTEAVGRVGRKLFCCQSACAAIQRDHRLPSTLLQPL